MTRATLDGDAQHRTDGSLAALGTAVAGRFVVAPTTQKHTNTLRPMLRAEAAFRIDSHRFDVGSSFLLANSINDLGLLARIRPPVGDDERHHALRLAIFGHADMTGSDADNKTLSGRRALCLYGILVRDVSLWAKLHDEPKGSDDWGVRSVQWMLAALGFAPGKVDGDAGPKTESATRAFQNANGLQASGKADGATRKKMYGAYMDLLCVDDSGAPFRYFAADFLDEGTDSGHKGACQGCGELNPLVVPSKARADELAKPKNKELRDEEYRNNRRVVVYLFSPKLRIPLASWPCPTAEEGAAKCKESFWRDGDARRKPGEKGREHMALENTFACRFYDTLGRFSPVEVTRRTINVWLLDEHHRRMPGAEFRATVGGGALLGRADGEGKARIEDVVGAATLSLEWGAAPSPQAGQGSDGASAEPGAGAGASAGDAPKADLLFRYRNELHLDLDDFEDGTEEEVEYEALRRLQNLGYPEPTFYEKLASFQRDYGLEEKDWPDEASKEKLWSVNANGEELAPENEESGEGPDATNDPLFTDDSR